MNVQKVWDQNITGKGIVVTILDDGLEKDHPDIAQNYVSEFYTHTLIMDTHILMCVFERPFGHLQTTSRLIKNELTIIKKSSFETYFLLLAFFTDFFCC